MGKKEYNLTSSNSVPSFEEFQKEHSNGTKPPVRSISFSDDNFSDGEEVKAKEEPTTPTRQIKKSPLSSSLLARRHTLMGQAISNQSPTPIRLHLEEDTSLRHEKQHMNLQAARRNTMVGILGFGKVPKKVTDLVIKKRKGGELTWEDMEYFIKGLDTGLVSKEQAGAMMIAFDLVGLSMLECESLMKAMMFSGQLLHWPGQWLDILASLQSTGSTGNKAKPIVASAMAAIGLKFPIMSARGTDVFAGINDKMSTIPGFDGKKSFQEVKDLLEQVGCCIVSQPQRIAPAETTVRDLAAKVGVSDNNAVKAACMMARVCALKLRAVVLEITCGPSESVKTSAQAEDLVKKLQTMATIMGVRCKVVLTHVDGPIGRMIGQTLSVAEAVRCLNGEGPADLHEVVCKIGGHVLQAMNRVDTAQNGEKLVAKVLQDGSAKKKFIAMLQAQGVDKATVKNLFKHRKDPNEIPQVLPTAQYFTHLTTSETGFVHMINTTICNQVMYELRKLAQEEIDDENDEAFTSDENNNESNGRSAGAGGIQLMVHVGTYLTRGDCWAKIHHNVRLTEDMVDDLKRAITLKLDPPLYDMAIDMKETAPQEEEKEKKGRKLKWGQNEIKVLPGKGHF